MLNSIVAAASDRLLESLKFLPEGITEPSDFERWGREFIRLWVHLPIHSLPIVLIQAYLGLDRGESWCS
jgi:hypothetical protein